MMVWKRYILWWHIHLLFETSGCNQTHYTTGHHRLFTIPVGWFLLLEVSILEPLMPMSPLIPPSAQWHLPWPCHNSPDPLFPAAPHPPCRNHDHVGDTAFGGKNGCKIICAKDLFYAGKLGSWLNGYIKSWFSILGPNKKRRSSLLISFVVWSSVIITKFHPLLRKDDLTGWSFQVLQPMPLLRFVIPNGAAWTMIIQAISIGWWFHGK